MNELTTNQQLVLSATNLICDTVKVTLGTKGRTVLFNTYVEEREKPLITKDGATVAKNLISKNDYENMIVSIIREASLKTMLSSGDGTTTTCVILQEIVKGGMSLINSGVSYYELDIAINQAVKDVRDYIKANSITIDEENIELLKEIATISANNAEVGQKIYDIISEIGIHGNIEVKRSELRETVIDTVKGAKIWKGYTKAYMVNNLTDRCFEADGCNILIYKGVVRDWTHVYEYLAMSPNGLTVFCDDISENVSRLAEHFIQANTRPLCFVEHDGFGDRKEIIMKDLSIITGANIVDAKNPIHIENLGKCDHIRVEENHTFITGVYGDEDEIESEVEDILMTLESDRLMARTEMSNLERRFYERRLANYAGGISVIQVGGNTQVEMNELKDRYDDAVLAVSSTIKEGACYGGGYTFLNCYNYLLKNLNTVVVNKDAYKLVLDAITAPFNQLLINSDLYTHKDTIKSKILKGQGYDLRNNKHLPLKSYKVYDSTAVLLDALHNGVSTGKLLLSVKEVVFNGVRNV